jgi:hypothetical protein
MRATVAAVVLTILMLTSSGTAANARGSGYGGVSPHFAPTYRALPFYRYRALPYRYGAFPRQPLYGGFIGAPYYGSGSDDFFDYPPYAPYAPDTSSSTPGAAPSTNRCPQPTHKTVTVPAEAGGTQQITVTYCHP